jgi:hypothetical protein
MTVTGPIVKNITTIDIKNQKCKNNLLWYYINICPTRSNCMQFISFYFKITLHVSGVGTPIIRSTLNCNHSLRYRSKYRCTYLLPTWPGQHSNLARLEGGSCTDTIIRNGVCSYNLMYSWWWVCRHPKYVEWCCNKMKQIAYSFISLDEY